ncbi:TIR domain-containing protein [Bradyrhizobium japonicum]|uniref:TIR domain-containing protein n=1 Tax=Bradyrhizobium japonicum TaxID=375 RepID=UPI001BA92737|nr:TIR domain-containing protein [Bradyrhizobium japonicum]MBR0956935.1 nucleotide-binding protein [Bradyrhizobium japonicum]
MADKISFDPRILDFLRASHGRSQEAIIVEFLQTAIAISPAADAGSVLIDHPKMERLVLFNEDDFLFRERLLDSRARAKFPTQLGYFGTIAGNCFRTGTPTIFPHAQSGELFGDSPIQNMVCFPIKLGRGRNPFGVACFHNNIPDKAFSPEDQRVLEAYTDILALALHTPHPELQLDRNVFIVHGRDDRSRQKLESILRDNRVNPKVLLREDKNAAMILSALEELIRTCKAGFILATPDDVGRLGQTDDELTARARENVIFEMGMLFAKFRAFDRVAILLKKPLKLPSDLHGVTYEEFDQIDDIEATIVRKLSNWKLLN